MNKNFISTLFVSALIMFMYQSISWMASPIHKGSFKSMPNQDAVLKSLENIDEGYYMLPYTNPDASMEEHEEIRTLLEGKPWAHISYHKSWGNNMVTPMIRGFIINLISVFIVLFVLKNLSISSFKNKFLTVFLFGVFLIFQSQLLVWNWMETPSNYLIPEIIDDVLSWGIAGLFIAKFFKMENCTREDN